MTTAVVIDACALINIVNGGLQDDVLVLEGHAFLVGPIVIQECGVKLAPVITGLVTTQRLLLIDEQAIPAEGFLHALGQYGLGDGETECLVYAVLQDAVLCSDDRAARRIGREVLGEGRVTGTLGLLRLAVERRVLLPERALLGYREMQAQGGFLPDIGDDYFRVLVPN